MTRSPARSPMAIAETSTTMPAAMTTVAKRRDGSCIGRLYMLERLRRDISCGSAGLALGRLAQEVQFDQLARAGRHAFGKSAKLDRHMPGLIDQVAKENAHRTVVIFKRQRRHFNGRRGNFVAHVTAAAVTPLHARSGRPFPVLRAHRN